MSSKTLLPKIRIDFGKDSLLNYSFQYYFIPLLYLISYLLILNQISVMYLVSFVFFFIPLMDEICDIDLRNPTKEEERELETQLRFKLPLYVCVFCDWLFTVFCIKTLVNSNYNVLN